jgi:hypothetical protein
VPTFQCPNPACGKQSQVPDQFVGRRVRCKNCDTEFVAGARQGNASRITAAPPAAKTATPPAAKVVRVAARRRDEGRPGGFGWLLAAFAAFLLPVVAAGGFVALKWNAKHSAPPAAERYAGVDVGSSGVTYTIFEVFQHPEHGYVYRVLLFENKTTDLTQGMEKTGAFDPDGLTRTTDAVRRCYEKLTEVDKIQSNRIFIVGSGGLLGAVRDNKVVPPDRRNELITRNRSELSRAVHKAVGKTMDFVDLDEEAEYQLDAMVEPDHLDTGMYLDVGTGATRGGYRGPVGVRKFEVAGIKAFAGRAKNQPGGVFGPEATRLADSLIRRRFRDQAEKVPEFGQRQHVYLGGGIVWVLSTCQHPKVQVAPPEAGLYVSLTAEDIEAFAADVRKGKAKGFLESYQPPVGLSAEEKQKVQEEIKRMHGPFPPEKLAAGAEILAALSAEMQLKGKNLRFHRYAHVAWLMAYIAKHAGLKR